MDKYTENELHFPETERKPRYYIPPRQKEESEEAPRMSAREYYRMNRDGDSGSIRNNSYSHRTGSYRSSRARKDEKISFKERLMSQSIAAGAVLLLVLVINFLNIGFVNDIKAKVKASISQNVTLEQVYSIGSQLTDSVKTIFGFENEKQYDSDIDQIKEDVGIDTDISHGNEGTDGIEGIKEIQEVQEVPTLPDGSFRIDEEILNEINSAEDPYIKNR